MPDVCTTHQRSVIQTAIREDENAVVERLIKGFDFPSYHASLVKQQARELVEYLRTDDKPGLMEVFLSQYGLSTEEGVALMCLAEALLRVPDGFTADKLIEDKIATSDWDKHLGQSSSSLVNAATWGLMLTGKVLNDQADKNIAGNVRSMIKRLGEPAIRIAVKRAMKELGHQFVLGESIESATKRGGANMASGFSYSYDMLGEAALTQADADKYLSEYKNAINHLLKQPSKENSNKNAGISIKLSALHPRYESINRTRVMKELTPIVLELSQMAKSGNLGINIDAEESERLDLSLEIIETVLSDDSLKGWDGFGVVVQAYNKSASHVIEWLYDLAKALERKITVRLVKGAYWDAEIKRAQVNGVKNFPVFTSKAATDVSYLCCANKLLSMRDVIFPQFATHNACIVAHILQMTDDIESFEFQRLHGMGESLYRHLVKSQGIRCRIYAPVGKHKDLLAYLVRRLLENGANSSFVNQIVDKSLPIDKVITDPFEQVKKEGKKVIDNPSDLFGSDRTNSKGLDLFQPIDQNAYTNVRDSFRNKQWKAIPLTKQKSQPGDGNKVFNPSDVTDCIGTVAFTNEDDIKTAIAHAKPWKEHGVLARAAILNRAADLLESNAGEIFAILSREAGKNAFDAVAEIREAVDFLRFYAAQGSKLNDAVPCGVFACISPWNFPLAIFIGQIAAALVAGNGVIAKPAESTSISAWFATQLLHKAGVPFHALQLLPGEGSVVGELLTTSPNIDGVCFTGSTQTALRINRKMAEYLPPLAPLIAETGGLNCMIVDSTALLEQAIKDVVRSAFQSAGQRCSALRMLYIQDEIYTQFIDMLSGAIEELTVANPWHLNTDVGPVINKQAFDGISQYINEQQAKGNLVKEFSGALPENGFFIPPTVVHTTGIEAMEKEIFGPVLHVCSFKVRNINGIVDAINASGYGLTFGIHSRINTRVEKVVHSLNVGNVYVNRDQIGAIVGSQPFGGENLSGTGPKAGGPHYLTKFVRSTSSRSFVASQTSNDQHTSISFDVIQDKINSFALPRTKVNEQVMPGPTGESNVIYEYAKGVVLCLGSSFEEAKLQADIVEKSGAQPLIICADAKGPNAIRGVLKAEYLSKLENIYAVALMSTQPQLREYRQALAERDGAILPLLSDLDHLEKACVFERHVCIDTTASGGNASLLAIAS